jgi:hypothetical protein
VAGCSAIVGSLAIHGALALIIALAIHAPIRPPAGPGAPRVVAIDLVLASPPAPSSLVPSVSSQAHAGSPPAVSPAPLATPRHVRMRASHASAAPVRAVETTMQIEASRDAGTPGTGDGSRSLDGRGTGDGRGNGIGLGAGGRIDPRIADLPLPVSTAMPVASRARPPRLIYPARDRDAEDSLLFVARLTIDVEGFVIGARLVRGVGGRRDDQAASAVWRFRYRPALDDDGRPIAATIEQRFLVE